MNKQRKQQNAEKDEGEWYQDAISIFLPTVIATVRPEPRHRRHRFNPPFAHPAVFGWR